MVKSQIQLELEALRQQKLTNTHRTKLKEVPGQLSTPEEEQNFLVNQRDKVHKRDDVTLQKPSANDATNLWFQQQKEREKKEKANRIEAEKNLKSFRGDAETLLPSPQRKKPPLQYPKVAAVPVTTAEKKAIATVSAASPIISESPCRDVSGAVRSLEFSADTSETPSPQTEKLVSDKTSPAKEDQAMDSNGSLPDNNSKAELTKEKALVESVPGESSAPITEKATESESIPPVKPAADISPDTKEATAVLQDPDTKKKEAISSKPVNAAKPVSLIKPSQPKAEEVSESVASPEAVATSKDVLQSIPVPAKSPSRPDDTATPLENISAPTSAEVTPLPETKDPTLETSAPDKPPHGAGDSILASKSHQVTTLPVSDEDSPSKEKSPNEDLTDSEVKVDSNVAAERPKSNRSKKSRKQQKAPPRRMQLQPRPTQPPTKPLTMAWNAVVLSKVSGQTQQPVQRAQPTTKPPPAPTTSQVTPEASQKVPSKPIPQSQPAPQKALNWSAIASKGSDRTGSPAVAQTNPVPAVAKLQQQVQAQPPPSSTRAEHVQGAAIVVPPVPEATRSKGPRINPNIVCFNCRQIGHISRKCTSSKKPRDTEGKDLLRRSSSSNRRCFNCGQVGHISSACTQPSGGEKACYNCRQTGHLARNCPNKKGSC